MVTDSCRMGQECTTDQQQGHNMAAVAAPELPEEAWEDELMLPSGPLDWEQIVDRVVKPMRVCHWSRQEMEEHSPRSSLELTQKNKPESSDPPMGTQTQPVERPQRFQYQMNCLLWKPQVG